MNTFQNFLLFIYIFIIFFQKPAWMDELEKNVRIIFFFPILFFKVVLNKITANTSNIPYIECKIFLISELILSFFLILANYIKRRIRRKKIRLNFFHFVFLITLITNIVYFMKKSNFQLNLFLRPIVLLLKRLKKTENNF